MPFSPPSFAIQAAMAMWFAISAQPSSSNQSTPPGFAPVARKLSVMRCQSQALRSSMTCWKAPRSHFAAENAYESWAGLPSTSVETALILMPS